MRRQSEEVAYVRYRDIRRVSTLRVYMLSDSLMIYLAKSQRGELAREFTESLRFKQGASYREDIAPNAEYAMYTGYTPVRGMKSPPKRIEVIREEMG